MISKKNRFHGRGSLDYLYRKGRSVRCEGVTLRYMDSKRGDYRLAVVVSKKVSKLAVVRNRIRRRVYETVRLLRAEDENSWHKDLMIVVFDENLSTMSVPKTKALISQIFEKAGRKSPRQ